MTDIKLLTDELASKIAAGEVVERPASVVKELIENSIDANATDILININQGGKELIQIRDNGKGIPSNQLELAVMRHATSKISDADDLFNIHTLGFRGEALASIGSVSRMTIRSKTKEATTGMEIIVDNSSILKKEICSILNGTDVRVENLFYSVPARLKFLKKEVTEKRQITNILLKMAIAYPNIKFNLNFDGKNKFETTGNGNRREILAIMYNIEIAKKLLLIDTEMNEIEIYGFISPLDITRGTRKEITFFINGRSIHNSALVTALVNAYHSMLMVNRYPIAILFLNINPKDIDVNVHPTKAEVRFKDSQLIFSTIQRTVKRSLMAYSPLPKPYHISSHNAYAQFGSKLLSNSENPFATNTVTNTPFGNGNQADIMRKQSLDAYQENSDVQSQSNESENIPLIKTPLLNLVGQIAQTYLIAEAPDGLYLIDQHAAHERVLYEKYMKTLLEGEISSQALLAPEVIQIPRELMELVTERLPLFNKIGFEIEVFGNSEVIIRSVPTITKNTNPREVFSSALEKISDEDESAFAEVLEELLVTRICKGIAIKGGQTLHRDQQQKLLRDLENCINPRTCPHGRPTMIHLSIDTLERQFGRRNPL